MGRYTRRVETEKWFARTPGKDKTVEFSDSLVNNGATIKKEINATTFARYLKFTSGTLPLKST